MFVLEVAPCVLKELQSIKKGNPSVFNRLKSAIASLSDDPYQGKSLGGDLAGKYSIRVGSYRIIYCVYKTRLVIYVLDVGHRREIYR